MRGKIILTLILITILITSISASRLPSVGSDNETWGTILNDFLIRIGGENATELNLTMVNGSNIYSSAINSTHIATSSVADDEIDYSTVTLTDFTNDANYLDKDEGGVIDGSLTLNGNLTLIGSYLNATVTNQYLNGSFFPDVTDLFNLGSSVFKWANLYVNNVYASKVYSDDWTNVSITESQVSDADWWDANSDLSDDEISESKINFATSCGAGNHLYINGNDLGCEADKTGMWTNVSNIATYDGDINVTGTSYLGSMDFSGGNISATNGEFENINVTGTSTLGTMNFSGGNITATNGEFENINVTGNAYLGDLTWNGDLDLGNNNITNVSYGFFDNVGIGTDSPQANLVVSDNDGESSIHIVSDSDGDETSNSLLKFFINGDDGTGTQKGTIGYIESDDVMKINYGGSANNHLTVSSAGKVGIGTDSPDAKLQINDNYNALGGITPVGIISTNENNIQSVHFENENAGTSAEMRFVTKSDDGGYLAFTQPSSNNTGSFFGLTKSEGSFIFSNTAGSDPYRDLAIGTYAPADLIFGTDNEERMRIDSSGKVGIGTDSPAVDLDINGDVNFNRAFMFGLDYSGFLMDENTGTQAYFVYDSGSFQIQRRTGGNVGDVGTYQASPFRININAPNDAFWMGSDGKVGIGTDSPDDKLQVAGNVIIGDGEAGTDYTLTFDGETNDGVITWMEDENRFDFNATVNTNSNFSVGANVGLTGNYSVGECWMAYTGGIVTSTNCTAL